MVPQKEGRNLTVPPGVTSRATPIPIYVVPSSGPAAVGGVPPVTFSKRLLVRFRYLDGLLVICLCEFWQGVSGAQDCGEFSARQRP